MLEEWLTSHAIDLDLLRQWNVMYVNGRLEIPVFSIHEPHPALWLERLFDSKTRYNVQPAYCKRGFQLYGLRATAVAVNRRGAVVVEGFSDVLSLYNVGVWNTVGMLGSRLSAVQKALLRSFTSDLIVWSDGDEAGEAYAKSIGQDPLFSAVGVTVAGMDPAEFVASGGKASALLDAVRELSPELTFCKFAPDLTLLGGITRA